MNTQELHAHREHMLASIRRILTKYSGMDAATKRRADRTMENLHGQLNLIDEFLCSGIKQ